MSKIAIIGSGKVGTATGMGLMQLGHQVMFYDIDQKRVLELTRQGLNAGDNLEHAIRQSNISFICVPTPYNEGIDLRYLVSAVKEIAGALMTKWHLVVVKSTVVPLTTEKVVLPILEASRAKFGLCMNPEFLTEIAATWTDDLRYQRDFWAKERIVIGELSKKSGDVLGEIYKPLGAPIFRTDLRTAEMLKYATNMMLATKISYWNELFLVCKELGIDSQLVADITALDARIGKYGTVHGMAFGGKCLDKDLSAFIKFAEKYHIPRLLNTVWAINDYMSREYGVRE